MVEQKVSVWLAPPCVCSEDTPSLLSVTSCVLSVGLTGRGGDVYRTPPCKIQRIYMFSAYSDRVLDLHRTSPCQIRRTYCST
jgi:hypothetical protein